MLKVRRSIIQTAELLILLAVLSLTLTQFSGCNKSGNNYDNTPNGPGGPGTNEVWIQGNAFDPTSLTVSQGTSITWTNKDGVTHTVTSDTPGLFTSGSMGGNATFTHSFNTAGTFAYHCNFHANMHGTVIVTPTVINASINMQNNLFSPAVDTVAQHTVVTWTNLDNVAHTVTSGAPGFPNGIFSSSSIPTAGIFSHTFDSLGVFLYYCTFHQPMMIGTIIVQ
jgi:plastocyanin